MKLLILLALVAVSFGQNTPRVKLDIYYEALCPDTFAYINQLSAVYSSFRNNLDITYIPFGKGNSSVVAGQVEFTCQRGAPECLGNRIQATVLDRIRGQDEQLDYISCQMQSGAAVSHQPCVEAAGLNFADILAVANSDSAIRQQLSLEQLSIPVIAEFDFVPTILYNGKIFPFSMPFGGPTLTEVLCDFLNNNNEACSAIV